MKKPEEIKLALDCFNKDVCCDKCSYDIEDCTDKVEKDAFEYILQLERELNAAVNILKDHKICDACSHRDPHYGCDDDCYECRFEWRGMQEG